MHLGSVDHSNHFSPAGAHIGDVQSAGKNIAGIAATMLHQVDLDQANALVVPVGKRARRRLR